MTEWKKYLIKLYEYAHQQGIFIMHYSDSNKQLIMKNKEEMGVDIWQGSFPSAAWRGFRRDSRERCCLWEGLMLQ